MKKCVYKGNCPFWYHGCEDHDLDKCKLKEENSSNRSKDIKQKEK